MQSHHKEMETVTSSELFHTLRFSTAFSKHILSSNPIPQAPAGRLEMRIQYSIQSQSYGPFKNANRTVMERLGCFTNFQAWNF
jgi:hypothetical protein